MNNNKHTEGKEINVLQLSKDAFEKRVLKRKEDDRVSFEYGFSHGFRAHLKIASQQPTVEQERDIEQLAKDYAEANQYSLEEHDEGGYLGINERKFAEHLITFVRGFETGFKSNAFF